MNAAGRTVGPVGEARSKEMTVVTPAKPNAALIPEPPLAAKPPPREASRGEYESAADMMSVEWSADLEPSAWDRMRASALAHARPHRADGGGGCSLSAGAAVSSGGSGAGLAGSLGGGAGAGAGSEAEHERAEAAAHSEGGGEGEEGEEGEGGLRARPKRTIRPARGRTAAPPADDDMTATERRELKRALAASRTIQHMSDGASANLPEAPVYHPTADEFEDPMAYIAAIRSEAQKYGACKIVPPAGWRAPGACAVPEAMEFEPRLMPIHKLQQGVGFQTAPATTLAAYRARADEFKAELCRRHAIAPDDDAAVEALFWRIVQTEAEPVVVQYGADLDVNTHASGFAEAECGAWNLRRLASHPESLLRHLRDGVPGVSSPWLYVGMLYGAFCWHVEDLWMYSCNHLHAGAPKTWYTVPATGASKFERAARRLLPALFDDAPDLLFQLVAMLAPSELCASGVPVYKITQTAGSFVVTFPRAYHAGFSHGFNVAEAVNFAATDWLPFGRNAMAAARKHARTPCFSVERLLCTLAASKSEPHVGIAPWLVPEVEAIVEEEVAAREAARADGLALRLLTPGAALPGAPGSDPADENLTCGACSHILYLSGVAVADEPTRCMCLRHAALLQRAPAELLGWQRYHDAGLRRIATCRGVLAASKAA